jgi:hypothetical protein
MENAAPQLPQRFNFAQHLLALNEARGGKIAYRDDHCELTCQSPFWVRSMRV